MREKRTGDIVTFEKRAVLIPLIFGAAALFLLYQAVMALVAETPDYGNLAVASVGALVFSAGAIFLGERSIFAFDRSFRRLRWRRSNVLTAKSGEIRFDDITGVELQSISGSGTSRSYRIMLRARGGDVPMTRGYSGNAEKWRPIAEQIRACIGSGGSDGRDGSDRGGDPLDSGVAGLVRDGRIIDAVRQLRDTKGLSLKDAQAEVDRLKADR